MSSHWQRYSLIQINCRLFYVPAASRASWCDTLVYEHPLTQIMIGRGSSN
jgi:hypothetical protein